MKQLLTYKKTALSLTLFAALTGAAWAQTNSTATAKTAASVEAAEKQMVTEVLDATETKKFFDEMIQDLAADGYKITFGETLPKVAITSPKVFTKPLSAEKQKQFFDQLQQSLKKSGIEVDFGKELPKVERISYNENMDCDDDFSDDFFDDYLLGRYDDRAEDSEAEDLLEALLLKRYIEGKKGSLRPGDDVTDELMMLLDERN